MDGYFTSALATLLVVIDPIFLTAIFLGLTSDLSNAHRREVALRGSLIAFVIMVAAGLGGARLLLLLGISLSAFRIAGGLLLLSAAAEMVFDRRATRLQDTAKIAVDIDHVRNIAAFPLAIPLMAGPGAITAMILLSGKAEGSMFYLVGLFAITGFVVLTCYICFLFAQPIGNTMGITGRAVVSRLLGIILAALAVQFMIDGVKAVIT